jgi:hypothetical protein
MSVSDPSDSIDRSVQLPMKMPPTWCASTTARASAAPVTPTMSSWPSLSRVDRPANSACPSPHAGGAGAAGSGMLAAVVVATVVFTGLGAGEHASSSPDSAASAHKARGKAMGPETSNWSRTGPRGRRSRGRRTDIVAVDPVPKEVP